MMNDKMISCEFNIATACVEAKYADGTMISIGCTAVSYVELILNGNAAEYLRAVRFTVERINMRIRLCRIDGHSRIFCVVY